MQEEANRIIRHHVYSSVGTGLIPIPIVDLTGLALIRLNLMRKLAKLYGIPFLKPDKSILSSWPVVLASFVDDAAFILVGSAFPASATFATSLAKAIPVIGQSAGVLTMPIISGAVTYAIGKVFNQHFASGGTFLTFDPEKVKDYYAEMFEQGKKVAEDIKKQG